MQLVTPYIKNRKALSRAPLSMQKLRQSSDNVQIPSTTIQQEENNTYSAKKAPKKSRCQLCAKSDNKTPLICVNCKKILCKKHSNTVVLCTQCNKI